VAVRARSEDNPLITSGRITLDLPGLPSANIGPDGEANFKGVSARFKGMPIKMLAQVDGYEEKWRIPTVEGSTLAVNLGEPLRPIIVQIATLVPPPVVRQNPAEA
jgi:hypothetical protein